MILKTRLLGKTYAFRDIKDALAKANEDKTGDRLAGIGGGDRSGAGRRQGGGGQPAVVRPPGATPQFPMRRTR